MCSFWMTGKFSGEVSQHTQLDTTAHHVLVRMAGSDFGVFLFERFLVRLELCW